MAEEEGRRRRKMVGGIIENSEILADGMIAAAAFTVVRGG